MGHQGLTIGDLSSRSGLAVSAIRFYETHGIVLPLRNQGGHRRYSRADLRRLSFALITQRLGFSLAEIAGHLAALPNDRAPDRGDWERIAHGFRGKITDRILALQTLADKLDGCIGCGCLSLDKCSLYNTEDRISAKGTGPRYLLGDGPEVRSEDRV